MADDNQGKILETANVVEKKTMNVVDSLEGSRIGEAIPLEIMSLSLYDITKYLMFFIILDSIPVYLISCSSGGGKISKVLIPLRNYGFVGGAIVSSALNLVAFYGKMIVLYKFVVLATLAKTVMAIIVIMTSCLYSLPSIILAVLYSIEIVGLDGLFLCYLAILLRRIESDEYDGKGEKLKKVNEAQEEKV